MKKLAFLLVASFAALSANQEDSWQTLPDDIKQRALAIGNYSDFAKLPEVSKELAPLITKPDFLTNFAKNLFTQDKEKAARLLEEAFKNRNTELIKALLSSDKTLKQQGEDLFHAAASNGNLEDVQTMLKAGVNPNAPDALGNIPLIKAVQNNHTNMVNWLINNGADINARGQFGDKALRSAKNAEMAKLLIEKGSEVDSVDYAGFTPLIAAAADGYEDVVKLLLEQHAGTEFKDNNGFTVLMHAIKTGQKTLADLLIKSGAQVNTASNEGTTPLLLALESEQPEIAQMLLTKGADPLAVDGNQITVLMKTVAKGYKDLAQKILERKPNINAQNLFGSTALMWAATFGKKDIAQLLLAHGANAALKDKQGKTALDLARENNHQDMANLLEKENKNKR